jgi:hypothetical protein
VSKWYSTNRGGHFKRRFETLGEQRILRKVSCWRCPCHPPSPVACPLLYGFLIFPSNTVTIWELEPSRYVWISRHILTNPQLTEIFEKIDMSRYPDRISKQMKSFHVLDIHFSSFGYPLKMFGYLYARRISFFTNGYPFAAKISCLDIH